MFSCCERRLTRDVRAGLCSRLRLALACIAIVAGGGAWAQTAYPGLGRAATAPELAAWDIDVRPDFKGLPPGSGSVAQGQVIWEAQCASCHGVFGEATDTFSPLVGGTTPDDLKTGRVARLTDPTFPGRTTLMKVATLSTLWDYIRRAMPWTAPKSLSTDQVYAVTAYLLNMGGIVPDAHVLSDANMAATQRLMPNRNGMTTDHGLWPGKLGRFDKLGKWKMGKDGHPDVQALACMKNCGPEAEVASSIPDFARNNQGNLAEQQRTVGPQRGADTTRPAGAAAAAQATAKSSRRAASAASAEAAAWALAQQHNCLACHGLTNKIIGPAFSDVAARYARRAGAESHLAGKIKSGGQGVWGAMAMPSQTLSDSDALAIAQWLVGGAKK